MRRAGSAGAGMEARDLWDRNQVWRAIAYTVEQQGAPMAVYVNSQR